MSKCNLGSQDATGVPSDTVQLIFKGRRLIRSDKISDHGIEEGDTIEVYVDQAGC